MRSEIQILRYEIANNNTSKVMERKEYLKVVEAPLVEELDFV